MFESWNSRAVGLALSARETIEIAAIAGFAGVDLMVRDLVESGTDPDELRRRMDDLGLRGGAWPLPVTWRADAATYQDSIKDLPRLAKAAAKLGLDRTGTWILPEVSPISCLGETGAAGYSRTIDFHVERLGPIARILGDHGIRLGLEVIAPAGARLGREVEFVHRYAQLAEMFDGLRGQYSNVGLLVDAFHLYAAGEGPEVALAWGPDAVAWVHVADSTNPDRSILLDEERTLPGETGLSESLGLLELLQREGYSGPVTAEPLSRCRSLEGLRPPEAARATLAALKAVWPAHRMDPGTSRKAMGSQTGTS